MEKKYTISILKNIYSLLAVMVLVGCLIIYCLLIIKQEQDKLIGETRA